MKHIFQTSVLVLGFTIQAWAAAPSVSNVYATQRTGMKLVDITYDVTSSQTNFVTVSVVISNSTGILSTTNFSGDIGSRVATGTGRKIVWNGGADQNGQNLTGLRVSITASSGDAPVPTGMVPIPAGRFVRSDSRTIELSAFFMDQTEVTKGAWDALTNWAATNGYTAGSAAGKSTNHPAQYVQWNNVAKWCNARSAQEGLTPCYTNADGTVFTNGTFAGGCNWSADGYRLPTEAEWEYAARGGGKGTTNVFPWTDGTGNNSREITHSNANYWSSSSYLFDTSTTRGYHPAYTNGALPYTSPVGSFAPNAYGLFDMAGNVSEMCWDLFSNPYPTAPTNNPRGASSGTSRVVRGGNWGGNSPNFSYPYLCKVDYRGSTAPNGPANILGFRCVKAATSTDSTSVTSTLFNADFRNAAIVVLGGLSQTYIGTAKVSSASTTPSGLAVSLTYNGSTNRPVNVGSYVVGGTVTDPNYTGSTTGTLVIAKAILTVTANSTNKMYNTSNPPLTATIAGYVNGETAAVVSGAPTLSTTATLTSNTGTYPITVTQGTLSAANYNFSFAAGTLSVNAPLPDFATWAAAKGLSGDPSVEFEQDRDNDGIINGLEYAFGTNFVSGTQRCLTVRIVNGRPVVEVPLQDATTLSSVSVLVKSRTCLISGDWIPVNPAANTAGKPNNCAWFEPVTASANALFKLEAVLK